MRRLAVPDHGACPGAGDSDALITLFRHRHRVPRLEYIEEDAPRAWPALAAAGFTIERRTPVMIAIPATRLTPRSPAGITIVLATSDTDLAAAATVQHHAYQLPAPPGPQDVARLTRLTRRGGLVAIAVDESSGTVAGTGLIDVAGDRPAVGELAAVGVLTAFRRRGIASALAPTWPGPPTPAASAWSSWKPSPMKNRSTAAPGSPTPPPRSGPRSADLTPEHRAAGLVSQNRALRSLISRTRS